MAEKELERSIDVELLRKLAHPDSEYGAFHQGMLNTVRHAYLDADIPLNGDMTEKQLHHFYRRTVQWHVLTHQLPKGMTEAKMSLLEKYLFAKEFLEEGMEYFTRNQQGTS